MTTTPYESPEDNPTYLTIMIGIEVTLVAKMEWNQHQQEYIMVKQSPGMSKHAAQLWIQAWAEREGLEIR